MERQGNGMDMIGKRISVYFDDGEKIARKQGVCTSSDDDFLILDYKNGISKNKIIRIEVES